MNPPRIGNASRSTGAAALAILLLLTPPAGAGPFDGPVVPVLLDRERPAADDPPETAEERAERRRRVEAILDELERAFEEERLDDAAELLDEHRELEPDSFVLHYNLACLHAMRGQADRAAESLLAAVQQGFDDIHQLRRDPHLEAVRSHETVRILKNRWPQVLDAQGEANKRFVTEWITGEPVTRTDQRLRLHVVSGHDETLTDEALAELGALAEWGDREIFGGILDDEDAPLDPWVVVALLRERDFIRWSVAVFGPQARRNFSAIGGAYDHDRKRLIAQDLGATLRHEFLHVLHYRDMARRGQNHPIWIQEGLCALVEDYDPRAGSIEPAPSWRTNIVKRRRDAGRLTRISQTAGITRADFQARRPLAHYASARSVFLFLWDRGLLRDWYRTYTDTYHEDPSGLRALEIVFDMPMDDVETAYRQWVEQLPMVAERGTDLDATLGVEIDEGTGDGPVIARFTRPNVRTQTRLRLGDAINAINGRPTRDMNELIRVLSDYHPGQTVELRYRRGRIHGTTTATLLPRDD